MRLLLQEIARCSHCPKHRVLTDYSYKDIHICIEFSSDMDRQDEFTKWARENIYSNNCHVFEHCPLPKIMEGPQEETNE